MPKTIKISVTGKYQNTKKWLKKLQHLDEVIYPILREYGEWGLQNLRNYTPKDTGRTAESWYYKIEGKHGSYQLIFDNRNRTVEGTPIVLLLEYGHGTKSGTFVPGYDFIGPAIRPIFDELKEKVWEEVVRL